MKMMKVIGVVHFLAITMSPTFKCCLKAISSSRRSVRHTSLILDRPFYLYLVNYLPNENSKYSGFGLAYKQVSRPGCRIVCTMLQLKDTTLGMATLAQGWSLNQRLYGAGETIRMREGANLQEEMLLCRPAAPD